MVPEGSFDHYFTYSYYTSDAFWFADGTAQGQNRYHKHGWEHRTEYGLSEFATLGAVTEVIHARQVPFGSTRMASNLSAGDVQLYMRGRLGKGKDSILSVQPLVKLPSFGHASSTAIPVGSDYTDLELRFLGGINLAQWTGYEGYLNLETAYRHRTHEPHDQWRMDLSAGLSLDEQWMLLGELFGTLRAHSSEGSVYVLAQQDDYDLLKGQCSVVYGLTPEIQLQLGAFSHLWGRNTGRGNGILLSLWLKGIEW